ncbi:MAG: alanine--tRNA ligase, partial [Verrucomicrobiae bacterium]|nr:alanine--tRNA ligase [Verrucomicrobiae bacterium]
DNFWMMGDTGPCGPCSEVHVDLTPAGDTKGALVNGDDARCIEVWNLVFIQFNAEPDGSFRPLPACHVDTGMGFERVCSIIQCTNGLTDFSKLPSNYNTDVFSPIFDRLSELSGKTYTATVPEGGRREGLGEQEQIDVAFRVIADHLRTLSFSVADGILPSNEGRGYVLRRILRRAVRFGRTLGLTEPFFFKLVDVIAETMGEVFPEIRNRRQKVTDTLRNEEDSFNRTLDKGIQLFESAAAEANAISGEDAFRLYDTYGFPLDLTELMARERGLAVDVPAFETLMEEQRQRARQDYENKKAVVSAGVDDLDVGETKFLGYEFDEAEAVIEAIVPADAGHYQVILDRTPCYAEMGGQVGDTGLIHVPGHDRTEVGRLRVLDTVKKGNAFVHLTELIEGRAPEPGEGVRISVEETRRRGVERHHTATHLFHWALHEIVNPDATQQGSMVAEDRLRFDFNSVALTPAQIAAIEERVNARVADDDGVSWTEVPHAEVRDRNDVMQFFGDKYGENVRVVQIGGQ